MKILVLSMLRLGDLLMHQEILNDLHRAYPNATLDIAINESFASAQGLLTGVRKFHLFERKMLQDNLVLKEGSFFRAFRALKMWTQEIRNENYDYVVDLTHNHFSRALVSLIQIPELSKPKRQFINEIFVDSNTSSFHYIDALKQSLGLTLDTNLPMVPIDKQGPIVIQPLTSDLKKNWSMHSFQSLIRSIHSFDSKRDIIIVGAPSEEQTLKAYFPEKPYLHVNICSLLELRDQLAMAAILISGDTATVHMAAMVGTPILGLFLGSAEPSKTAPRIAGAVLLQSLELCVPCRHSSPCSQVLHLCGESISADSVGKILKAMLHKDDLELKKIAWNSTFSVLRTEVHARGQFVIGDLSRPEHSLIGLIRQQAFQKIYGNLEPDSESLCSSFQGEPWELSMVVDDRLKAQDRIKDVIADMQDEVRKISRACLRLDIQVEVHLRSLSPLVREFSLYSEDAEWTSCLEATLKQSWEESSFVVYRRWRALVDCLSSAYEIETEILLSIKKNLRERGVYYVPGPTRST